MHNPYMMDKATSRDGAASENISTERSSVLLCVVCERDWCSYQKDISQCIPGH